MGSDNIIKLIELLTPLGIKLVDLLISLLVGSEKTCKVTDAGYKHQVNNDMSELFKTADRVVSALKKSSEKNIRAKAINILKLWVIENKVNVDTDDVRLAVELAIQTEKRNSAS